MLFSFGCVILTYHPLVHIMEKLLTTPTGILPDTTKLNDVLRKMCLMHTSLEQATRPDQS